MTRKLASDDGSFFNITNSLGDMSLNHIALCSQHDNGKRKIGTTAIHFLDKPIHVSVNHLVEYLKCLSTLKGWLKPDVEQSVSSFLTFGFFTYRCLKFPDSVSCTFPSDFLFSLVSILESWPFFFVCSLPRRLQMPNLQKIFRLFWKSFRRPNGLQLRRKRHTLHLYRRLFFLLGNGCRMRS